MYHFFFKRLIDLIISLSFLVILFPLIIVIFFIVWLFIGFPIFIQQRPGKDGKLFNLYKFKTLYDNSNLPEKNRTNKVGNFLRKTGLDEILQLINIVKNEMSLVGPRPLLKEYLNIYNFEEKRRHLVKPGITGLAQISPRFKDSEDWKKKIELDVYYVDNFNFFIDVEIIFKTVILVFLGKKISNEFSKLK